MNPGDVVLIRFPQANLQAGKLRPALLVAIAPGRRGDVLLAMITSLVTQIVANFDEIIGPTDIDYSSTGLKAPSIIRLLCLVTVTTGAINARLGRVSPVRLRQIRGRLASWLAP